ncbi:MAG: hypothetical protein VST67_09640, partial [Nitrospirota bacterium]|nr:hypothetical protein [Nitrospirota bacterium]
DHVRKGHERVALCLITANIQNNEYFVHFYFIASSQIFCYRAGELSTTSMHTLSSRLQLTGLTYGMGT